VRAEPLPGAPPGSARVLTLLARLSPLSRREAAVERCRALRVVGARLLDDTRVVVGAGLGRGGGRVESWRRAEHVYAVRDNLATLPRRPGDGVPDEWRRLRFETVVAGDDSDWDRVSAFLDERRRDRTGRTVVRMEDERLCARRWLSATHPGDSVVVR
jgi:hypothetical protein